jgi:hypothetical protein
VRKANEDITTSLSSLLWGHVLAGAAGCETTQTPRFAEADQAGTKTRPLTPQEWVQRNFPEQALWGSRSQLVCPSLWSPQQSFRSRPTKWGCADLADTGTKKT